MSSDFQHGARVVATDAYTLRTLTIRDDAFIAVSSGIKRLHRPDAALRVGRGQGVAIARGTQWDVNNDPHGTRAYQALALAFPAELLQEFNALGAATSIPAVHSAVVVDVDEELFDAMLRTLPPASTTTMSKQLLLHRIMEVLLLLGQRGCRFVVPDATSWTERIRRLVAQRPHAEWDVPTLAAAFNLSESTLRRRLDGSGITLAALVREVRLETALGMLQTTRLPIGDVAQHCGWQSHSRFTVAFQERWGVPPSVVRAKLKEDAQTLKEVG